jgi:hypothetical protein
MKKITSENDSGSHRSLCLDRNRNLNPNHFHRSFIRFSIALTSLFNTAPTRCLAR